MHASNPGIRTLALGAVLGAAAVGAVALVAGDREPAAAAAGAEAHRGVDDTKTQRSGRFAYVRTTFAVPANSPRSASAFCPRGAQVTGAFASAAVSGTLDSAILAVGLERRDGGDNGNTADNGIRGSLNNETSMSGAGSIDVICEFTKRK